MGEQKNKEPLNEEPVEESAEKAGIKERLLHYVTSLILIVATIYFFFGAIVKFTPLSKDFSEYRVFAGQQVKEGIFRNEKMDNPFSEGERLQIHKEFKNIRAKEKEIKKTNKKLAKEEKKEKKWMKEQREAEVIRLRNVLEEKKNALDSRKKISKEDFLKEVGEHQTLAQEKKAWEKEREARKVAEEVYKEEKERIEQKIKELQRKKSRGTEWVKVNPSTRKEIKTYEKQLRRALNASYVMSLREFGEDDLAYRYKIDGKWIVTQVGGANNLAYALSYVTHLPFKYKEAFNQAQDLSLMKQKKENAKKQHAYRVDPNEVTKQLETDVLSSTTEPTWNDRMYGREPILTDSEVEEDRSLLDDLESEEEEVIVPPEKSEQEEKERLKKEKKLEKEREKARKKEEKEREKAEERSEKGTVYYVSLLKYNSILFYESVVGLGAFVMFGLFGSIVATLFHPILTLTQIGSALLMIGLTISAALGRLFG